jgi:hypothetical protein
MGPARHQPAETLYRIWASKILHQIFRIATMTGARGRPYRKGENGNPGGRPRTKSIRLKVDEWTPEFLDELYKQATTSESELSRRSAIDLLWCRAYGKPVAPLAVQSEHRHFVLRAPAVLSSSDEWERKYGFPDAVDVTPSPMKTHLVEAPKPPSKPHVVPDLVSDLPPVPAREPTVPVYGSGSPGYVQGHTLSPSPYAEMTDARPLPPEPLSKAREETAEQRYRREARERREREISPSYRPPGFAEATSEASTPVTAGGFTDFAGNGEAEHRYREHLAANLNHGWQPGKTWHLAGKRRTGG